MDVLIDTSAFLAILDSSDIEHHRAGETWKELIGKRESLICHNYVLIEAIALIQRRLGIDAVRAFHEDIFPLLNIEWVDETHHQSGIAALFTASRRRLSLVDCASFEVMRRQGITRAFCFDIHFAEQGFDCIPAKSNASS